MEPKKLLWLIPIVIFAYLFYANTLPFEVEFFIDFGQDDTAGDARLTGPMDRVSGPLEMENITFRELRSGLVYFELAVPYPGSSSNVIVETRFLDNFPEGQKLMLGAKNKEEWSYHWKDAYAPFYENLAGFMTSILEGDNVMVYGAGGAEVVNFTSFDDFLENPPLGSVVASNIPLKIDVFLRSGKWDEMDLNLPQRDEQERKENRLVIDTALRGAHTLWTRVEGDMLWLRVSKQDLNWYKGQDELAMEVYDTDGTLVASKKISDDGEEGKTAELGPLQSEVLEVNLGEGSYRIELKGDGDLLIREIEINQQKLVVEGRAFIAGNNSVYFKDVSAPDPVRLYFKAFRDSTINFQVYHGPALQNIIIEGEGTQKRIEIDNTHTWFNTTVEPGSYQLTSEKGDVIIVLNNYFSFTPESYFLPRKCRVLTLQPSMDWIEKNEVDYLVIANYNLVIEDDGWKIARAEWEIKDLYLIEGNKLSFAFNVHHLWKEEYKKFTILVDWVRIRVKVSPL